MIIASTIAYSGAILLVAGAIVASILAERLRLPALALFALLPIGVGLIGVVFGIRMAPPHPAFLGVLALEIAALGVIAGSPLTVFVLRLATRKPDVLGEHGGILVEAKDGHGEAREVLRGGTTIGYLERFAIVGAIAVGHVEVIAAVIAIKGLGRYSELDSAAARERFIIGTLVSMIWASLCAALIVAG